MKIKEFQSHETKIEAHNVFSIETTNEKLWGSFRGKKNQIKKKYGS